MGDRNRGKSRNNRRRSNNRSGGAYYCQTVHGTEIDSNFNLAARNIKGIDVLPQQGANVYDILRRDILVLTQGAIEKLVERLK